MDTTIRVRFAPSPTGHLHIGGLRAAFFNWLFARHHNGTYLLRIEDTDLERSKQEYTDSILSSFAWTDLMPDEPIVIQSQRIQEHRAVAENLIREKKAYRCFCRPEDVAERLKKKFGDVLYTKYDEYCRNRSDHPNAPYAIRFAIPHDLETISFNDLIRGTVTFDRDQLDDFIIVRSDGTPMYNFVVVVDDAFMRISHVIRGEDHVSNTPKQILLYEACGYVLPQFAHLPMILGPSGDRLSKRDGAVSVMEYKNMGYLPEALLNYLVRLGWAHGDQEIFTREELIKFFSLDHVSKKGAIFDPTKLNWVNSVYLRSKSADELYTYITQEFDPTFAAKFPDWNEQHIKNCLELYKERVQTLREMTEEMLLLYEGTSVISDEDENLWLKPEALIVLKQVVQMLEAQSTFTVDIITAAVKDICKSLGIKLVTVAQPIRLALVGKTTSPGVFELLVLLGKKKSLNRICTMIESRSKNEG